MSHFLPVHTQAIFLITQGYTMTSLKDFRVELFPKVEKTSEQVLGRNK